MSSLVIPGSVLHYLLSCANQGVLLSHKGEPNNLQNIPSDLVLLYAVWCHCPAPRGPLPVLTLAAGYLDLTLSVRPARGCFHTCRFVVDDA